MYRLAGRICDHAPGLHPSRRRCSRRDGPGRAAHAEREARIAVLSGDAAAAAARATAARQSYLRYRDEIIPQLATIASLAELSYRSGQTGLTAYLQALQSAREVRLRAGETGLEYQTALADLERALGGPVQ